MKTTINQYDFERAFVDADRKENFSYEGLKALFEYFEQYEESTGEEIELDVIAICCEYNEDTVKAIAENYGLELPEDETEEEHRQAVFDYLSDHTSVVGDTSDGFVYACF
jgi:hypothetical protein